MANFITSVRIVCSILLLFFPAFSNPFYALYLTAGITDMVDGTVARKTHSVSEFGAKLDTVADLIFVVACILKLVPMLELEIWMALWIIGIAIIKTSNIVLSYILKKNFPTVHSVLNKITGACLFALPLSVQFIALKYSIVVVCTVATVAAVQEGYLIYAEYARSAVRSKI